MRRLIVGFLVIVAFSCGGGGGGGSESSVSTVNPYSEPEAAHPIEEVRITQFKALPSFGTVPLVVKFTWDIEGLSNRVTCFVDADGDGVVDCEIPCEVGECLYTYRSKGVFTATLTAYDEKVKDEKRLEVRVYTPNVVTLDVTVRDINRSPARDGGLFWKKVGEPLYRPCTFVEDNRYICKIPLVESGGVVILNFSNRLFNIVNINISDVGREVPVYLSQEKTQKLKESGFLTFKQLSQGKVVPIVHEEKLKPTHLEEARDKILNILCSF